MLVRIMYFMILLSAVHLLTNAWLLSIKYNVYKNAQPESIRQLFDSHGGATGRSSFTIEPMLSTDSCASIWIRISVAKSRPVYLFNVYVVFHNCQRYVI